MEEYKVRMVNEYRETKERYNKLHRMLVKYDAGTLSFMPTCPVELLRKQAAAMGKYLYILEMRAEIENVDLEEPPALGATPLNLSPASIPTREEMNEWKN